MRARDAYKLIARTVADNPANVRNVDDDTLWRLASVAGAAQPEQREAIEPTMRIVRLELKERARMRRIGVL